MLEIRVRHVVCVVGFQSVFITFTEFAVSFKSSFTLENGTLNYQANITPISFLGFSPLEPQPAQPFELPSSSRDPHIPPFKNILAWNVRGIGGADFRRIFRDMVNLHNPTAIILTETHLSGARAEAVISTLGFESFVRVHSMGCTGGIWLLWHPQSIHVAPIGATI
ncbi:hypothetical protein G2W53_022369 [Senna tora]|uniref:Endonuclease/exonuclease/phosphatase domain-containing protein n=1 Tax=Senna tora TaxID=362788 RepID=A0A834WI32_9FABA|nr:hypothetical protein G2W53_022362 [Senna tora]KAF7824225.1 hypothetical protein G2W53_022369 [Senna tora]